MIHLLLRRGADLDSRDVDGDNVEAELRHREKSERERGDFWLSRADRHLESLVLLAKIRQAGGWRSYVLFPRQRLLALRVLLERGRATRKEAPVARADAAARLNTLLAAVKAAPAAATALVAAVALEAAAPAPLTILERVFAPALPRGIFWLIVQFWRCDRDGVPDSVLRDVPRRTLTSS